ncbi:hypothetical protein HMPREF1074_01952 [Bacteroides xylanisolvens CL03T12C04]|uniref:Uncharacterized protein n=1 Tax=Bacteroides xylanisolvens CL03T12C04 TaxID=997892 RepID=I9UV06_9BACE|nr:hypothetical protein HMPREF1074_01952 [Bacteroides xylanisolvens CL03T12C04]CAG9873639.1 hypothetical protein BOVAC2_658 [Bacteroides ovatus]
MKVCKMADSLSDIGNKTVGVFIDDLSQEIKIHNSIMNYIL